MNTGKEEDGKQQGGMGSRGVTRPMMGHNMDHSGMQQPNKPDGKSDGKSKKQSGGMKMSDEMRHKMLAKHHRQTLWVYWTVVLLGFWMVFFPLTFNYGVGAVNPSGGRSVWLSLEQRIQFMKWSDILSGLGLIIFGWRSLTPNRPVSVWIACFIGIWLSMAPLIFWSPTAVGYLNGTLVGVLVIALTVLIPGMPNMILYMKMGSEVPPGWSYNPSSWPQRWIMIVLGFVGWVASRYLAAFQMGYIASAWDPFFGHSTTSVLNSAMSHSLPVSDAALGSLAYTFEFLMGYMGSPSRWRTMPWMVFVFGILVVPLGLVSIFLVISQPLSVGAWCTVCLSTAIIMLPMIPIELDEVIAMGQHMVQAKRRGDNLWNVFWKGGEPFEENQDERSPELADLPQRPGAVFRASIWGMSFPWTLVVSTVLGVWLMFAPNTFGVAITDRAADINHLGGALIVVTAVISMGEVVRVGRYLNVLVGLAVAIWIWFVPGSPLILSISSTLTGLIVAALSLPRGPKTEQYGLWDKYVK